MTEVKMYETILPGGAILRAGTGAEFRCCGPIIGEVWEGADETIRCTPCAGREDVRVHGHRAAYGAGVTSHRIVGTQSVHFVEID